MGKAKRLGMAGAYLPNSKADKRWAKKSGYFQNGTSRGKRKGETGGFPVSFLRFVA